MAAPNPMNFVRWLDLNLRLVLGAISVAVPTCLSVGLPSNESRAADSGRPMTFCNPLNLDYRFQLETPSRREAADPTMVRFNGEFWLFASKSGGYWHSLDMVHWTFIEPSGLPLEDYAPTVVVIGKKMFYTAFRTHALFSADNPLKGVWTREAPLADFPDPDLFLDDDGRLYMYFGCSYNGSISAAELDPAQNFKIVRGPETCFAGDSTNHGWEVAGEQNSGAPNGARSGPWIEGAWMNKHGGRYYLQYAAPGAQYKTYADGVYTATNPMGPFTYSPYSPFSHKPTGFIGSAGHSSTLEDARGNFWHATTMSIGVRHKFERRLGIFPTGFLPDGQMVCNTYLGDYPQFAPGVRADPARDNSPGWMLLSYAKDANASSTLKKYPVKNAFDEDVRTWWSAATGNPGEWLRVDLGKTCAVEAVQINFADQGAKQLGRLRGDGYGYYVEASVDGKMWQTCVDHRRDFRDAPHDYTQLDAPLKTRYLRLVNVHMPVGANFSVSDFRVFGHAPDDLPSPARDVVADRDKKDPRQLRVTWSPARGTEFYIVRFGIAPDRLFESYQVYGCENCEINSLNVGTPYYVAVDTVNGSGISRGEPIPAK